MDSATLLNRFHKVLCIRINHSYAGFFAYVTFVINQLKYCEACGYFPVVNFGPWSGDGPNAFYDPAHGENSWDYYFEPVAGLTFQNLISRIADPEDLLSMNDIVELDSDYLWYLHAFAPDSIYNYPYGYYSTNPPANLDAWYHWQRARARYFLTKYIAPKAHITAKVTQFWQQHLAGSDVIGLHMRGSDKGVTNADQGILRIIEPEEHFSRVDQFIDQSPSAKIFLATEQQQFVQRTTARYGDRVISRNVFRTEDFGPSSNPFQRGRGDPYLKGEEVLIDCLLLARCQHLLRCTSAVGEYAVYFNENLPSEDLNRTNLHPVAGVNDASSLSHSNQASMVQRNTSLIQSSVTDAGKVASMSRQPATATHVEHVPMHAMIGKGRAIEGVILINLDHRPDRLQRSLNELDAHGIAVHTTRMSAYRHENGLFGCSVSHVEAVRHARANGWRSVVIFEDDIRFSDAFAENAPVCVQELGFLPWGLFQFGAMLDQPEQCIVTENLFQIRRAHGAHAYALHKRAYDLILDDYICELDRGNWNMSSHTPFDEYLNNRLPEFQQAYGSRKLLVSQYPGISDTRFQSVDYSQMLEAQYERP